MYSTWFNMSAQFWKRKTPQQTISNSVEGGDPLRQCVVFVVQEVAGFVVS